MDTFSAPQYSVVCFSLKKKKNHSEIINIAIAAIGIIAFERHVVPNAIIFCLLEHNIRNDEQSPPKLHTELEPTARRCLTRTFPFYCFVSSLIRFIGKQMIGRKKVFPSKTRTYMYTHSFDGFLKRKK